MSQTGFEYRAALLAGDAIGKDVTVTYAEGMVTSKVTDKLRAVRHFTNEAGATQVELWFVTQKWTVPDGVGIFNLPKRREIGLIIPSDQIVAVHYTPKKTGDQPWLAKP